MSAPIRRLLEQALEHHGLSVQLDKRLPAKLWEQVVGPEISRRARPTVLVAGALHILVEDHRWRDQLDAMRGMVIARLNQRLGRPMVRELRFGLAHEGALRRDAPLATLPTASAAEAPAGAVALAAERLPDGLRQAFVAAASASARRAEAGAAARAGAGGADPAGAGPAARPGAALS